MKYLHGLTALSAIAIISACAPVQQQFSDQTFALGSPQPGYSAGAARPVAGALGQADELGLINILVGQLGISPQQALGGVGSIFSVAQQRMNPGDFSQLSSSVPGMDRYLSSVPQQASAAGSQSLLGAAGGLMGGQFGSLANLAGSFQSLGMNPSIVSQFVPVVLQYVQNQSGASAMSLLQHALY
ncbi:hypothetical protein [Methylomonas albis]|uniref:DUF2780 domain-containing protein n=1 Tax=Methylomonas albis TaxID=1854563 RepID=A0ABR9D3C4_9GAMM|nr:DUF2780 domain-containing protein [Methylomonas albis]MBD9357570.1 DUF2780 domain-containing protein [Methylomonas albis]CAD6880868.1 hypothetical protein [Methylomonas albis]